MRWGTRSRWRRTRPVTSNQWVRGNQNVQIHDVSGSTIYVTFGGQRREVPLEPPVVAVAMSVNSPARLIRARSGVVPYTARSGLLEDLERWADGQDAFAGCVIGGRGGTGKTRLGVELCVRAQAAGWLCGLLSRQADQAALEALVQAPTHRLVVIDYAELRAEQLEVLLPRLAAQARAQHRVRVLLLVRAGPRRTDDWTEMLRHHGDSLDAVLDQMDVRVLDDAPLELTERNGLFRAATGAFATRGKLAVTPAAKPPAALTQTVFTNPLLVVIAAYLAVHADQVLPTARAELLEELVAREDLYWKASAGGLDTDEALRRRVVALVTLAGAASEAEAVELLRVVPYLTDASADRRSRLARWAHQLYPGPEWWNPLEPDLLGEHLVATTYHDHPDVLAGVLAGRGGGVVRPVEVCARAAVDHPQLCETLGPIVTAHLLTLCASAAEEASQETRLDLLLGDDTFAAALNRLVSAIPPDPAVLANVLKVFPRRPNITLAPLVLTLTTQLVGSLRNLAESDSEYLPALARSLQRLSVHQGELAQDDDGLAVIEEAVAIYRVLAEDMPAVYSVSLGNALNSLSVRLAALGRYEEGLAASKEAVTLNRIRAKPGSLALSLINLSMRLGKVGQHQEGLALIDEAVSIQRVLAKANSANLPDLATSLNSLSTCLGQLRRHEDGLAASTEAVGIYRPLAEANPAAYLGYLAGSLDRLSLHLGQLRRHEEGLAASTEAVGIYRPFAEANPAAYLPDLAGAVNNLSVRLGELGCREEGLTASTEAIALFRRLVDANPAAYLSNLADSLTNLSVDLDELDRKQEAGAALAEAVEIRHHLAEGRPDCY